MSDTQISADIESVADEIKRAEICLRCPSKIMSFLQLVDEKKTSFLVGISNKFRSFLFCQNFGVKDLLKQKLWNTLESNFFLSFIIFQVTAKRQFLMRRRLKILLQNTLIARRQSEVVTLVPLVVGKCRLEIME